MLSLKPYKDYTIRTKWDPASNSMVPENLTEIMVNSTVSQMTLAFILAQDGTCKPAWGGYGDYSVDNKWGADTLREFIKNGGTATISFGGASGTPLESVCSTVSSLVNAIKQVITTYGVKRLDFDIEGANISNNTALNNLAAAISQIQQNDSQVKISLTLPALPTGLTYEGVNAVNIFKNHQVNFKVNIMAMDYGQAVAPDPNKMADYAIGAIEATHAQVKTIYPEKSDEYIWQNMLGLTPMIGRNDVEKEFFSLHDAKKIGDYAKQKGLEIGYWSLDRDDRCPTPQNWASPTCSGDDNGQMAQKKPYDYAKAFKGSLLLGLLITQKFADSTNSYEMSSNDSDDSTLLKIQILAATSLFLTTLAGGALLAKKYGSQISSTVKSAFSFWRKDDENMKLDEENHLIQDSEKRYLTFS